MSGLLRRAAWRGRKPFSFCFSSFFTCRRRLLLFPSTSLLLFCSVFVGDDSAFQLLVTATALCVSEPIIITIHFLSPQTEMDRHSITPNNRKLPHRKTTGQGKAQSTRQTFFDLLIWNATSARLCLPQSPRIALRFTLMKIYLYTEWLLFFHLYRSLSIWSNIVSLLVFPKDVFISISSPLGSNFYCTIFCWSSSLVPTHRI